MTTAIIVQARMGSTRLPGKVLLPLGAPSPRSVLGSVITRLYDTTRYGDVNEIVVAIPYDSPNELYDEAGRYGATVVTGPEDDVLERYRIAADTVGADTIIRVTADCPLIDPTLLMLQLKHYELTRQFTTTPPDCPDGLGVEVFPVTDLWDAANMATDLYDREHVTPWIHKRYGTEWVSTSDRRWSLNTQEDYERIQTIYKWLPQGRRGYSWIETMRAEDHYVAGE